MPVMKMAGESDNDCDLSGGDSDRSAASSRGADRDSSAEEADEPDSDDSSEMDEEECERRRNECLDTIADLERQFLILREQLYQERVKANNWSLSEVRSGKSQEYLGPLQRLQENMRVRIEVAGALRQLRILNVNNQFEEEEQAALQNFKSEKALAWDCLHEELQEKIRRLEEERNALEAMWNASGAAAGRARGRRKAVTVSGPYIVYMLSDQDIMEDWTIIKKALKRSIT